MDTTSSRPASALARPATFSIACMLVAVTVTLLLYMAVLYILVRHRRDPPFDGEFYRICRWLGVSDIATLITMHVRVLCLVQLRKLLGISGKKIPDDVLWAGMQSEWGWLVRTLHCVQWTTGVLALYSMMQSGFCIAVLLHGRRIALNPYHQTASYDHAGRLLLRLTVALLLVMAPVFLIAITNWIVYFSGSPVGSFPFLHTTGLKLIAVVSIPFIVVIQPLIVALTIATAFSAFKLVKKRKPDNVKQPLTNTITYAVQTAGTKPVTILPHVIQMHENKMFDRKQRILSGIRRSALYAVLLALPFTVTSCSMLLQSVRMHVADWPMQTRAGYWTGPEFARHLYELARYHVTGTGVYLMLSWYVGQNPYVFLLSSAAVRRYLWLYTKRLASSALDCVLVQRGNKVTPPESRHKRHSRQRVHYHVPADAQQQQQQQKQQHRRMLNVSHQLDEVVPVNGPPSKAAPTCAQPRKLTAATSAAQLYGDHPVAPGSTLVANAPGQIMFHPIVNPALHHHSSL